MMHYLTVSKISREEYVVNKSRFIGHASPVSSNEEALSFVNAVRAEFPDATHNVFAYTVRTPEYARFSDDGEPSGTAGKPVLDVIKSTACPLADTCVVVTRYFGGILLGTGGLVRAYSHSAKLAIDAAGIVKMSLCSVLTLPCPYNYYEKILKLIEGNAGIVEETVFAENVTLRLRLPAEKEAPFIKSLTELTFGAVTAGKVGEKYDVFPVE